MNPAELPVPEAIEQFKLVVAALETPVVNPVKPLQCQGILRALFPGKGRITRGGVARGNPHSACRQRIPVMKVFPEIETRLQPVDYADEPPWHRAELRGYRLIATAVLEQLVAVPLDCTQFRNTDDTAIEEFAILVLQVVEIG